MTFADPVTEEVSTRWPPSSPCSTVAVMPGLPLAELIAAARPFNVSLVLSMVTEKLELPSARLRVPVLIVAVPPPRNGPEISCCAEASCETVTLYDPVVALELAVAVKMDELLLEAVCELKAEAVS